MKIFDGIEMLEISASVMGIENIIHPTLLWDGETVILVDTGFPNLLADIQTAVELAGVPFERLSDVILTHHDIDHIGSLASIRAARPAVRVLCGEVEKAYIQGEKRPLKLAQMEANLASLSAEYRAFHEKMDGAFQSSFARVDQTLADGEELPYLGGIQVINTPGHTHGHICLYLRQSKTLIAGDTLRVENGELVRPAPTLNADQTLSLESLKKLANYDLAAVICYHGGLFQGSANRRIAELAAG
jgi:glyoxylase-like metal-dependent hydrolase (beta-lactamase superfamily II)